MPDKEINCRGLACPQPVLETKKALDELPEGARLTVFVDNPVAKENITLFSANAGHQVGTKENKGEFILTITKGKNGSTQKEINEKAPAKPPRESGAGKITYLITSNLFGQGSADLGQVLMKGFFTSLAGQQIAPEALIFLNTGVYLSTEGSQVIEHLQKLSARGASILSCGTCLDYYKLKEKLMVGRISNMYEICTYLLQAEKVITIA